MSKYLHEEYVRKFEDSLFYNKVQEPFPIYLDSILRNFIENTLNLDKDVDYIYKNSFKKIVDDYNYDNILPEKSIYLKISTSKLKNLESKKAHSNNPCEIICGCLQSGSFYDLINKKIYISIPEYIVGFLQDNNLSLKLNKMLNNELTESRLKSAIYHELSHWVRDSLNNFYLSDLFQRALNCSDKEKANLIRSAGKKQKDMSYYEIDAQIHGIKQTKIYHGDSWGKLTLNDLFYMYPTLMNVGTILYSINSKVFKIWIKDLVKRMDRENLLGKNMRIDSYEKILENNMV